MPTRRRSQLALSRPPRARTWARPRTVPDLQCTTARKRATCCTAPGTRGPIRSGSCFRVVSAEWFQRCAAQEHSKPGVWCGIQGVWRARGFFKQAVSRKAARVPRRKKGYLLLSLEVSHLVDEDIESCGAMIGAPGESVTESGVPSSSVSASDEHDLAQAITPPPRCDETSPNGYGEL
jgi:hypothetical protein